MIRSRIIGLGSYVPDRVVTNEEIPYVGQDLLRKPERQTDTDHAWIVERTGIEQRRYAPAGVSCSDLAVLASQRAIADAGLTAKDIDCVILGTLSPDIHFPGTAVFVQEKLGMGHFPACYDLRQQCSAFIYGLQMADALVRAGVHRHVLIIGSEVHSHALDFSTRGRDVMVLFGDAAGACVVGAHETNDPRAGVLYTKAHADGAGAWALHMKVFDISQTPIIHYDARDRDVNQIKYPQMDGRKVFVNAVKRMSEVSLKALAETGLTWADIDWFVPHQANLRISQAVAEKAAIPEAKVLHTIQLYGNTTAATIPLTIDHHRAQGRVKRGDLILAAVFGSGFTWGAAIFRLG